MKIYIKTYGCSMNQADSEIAAGLLKNAGFEIVNEKNAELIIVNTCFVKRPTEMKIMKKLDELKRSRKKVIVAGCISQAYPKIIKKKFPEFSIVGVGQIFNIAEIAGDVLSGKKIERIERIKAPKICLPKVRRNKVVEILPIASGCRGNCIYCFAKIARGELFSYPKEMIVEQVKSSLKQGAKEIWLTGQDTGCYGLDRGANLAELLREICKIEGKFFVRVGMMNPNHAMKMLDELIEAYKNEKIFKFLHLPVQSGNNEILKKMNRFYNLKTFKEIVSKFRKEIPEITLSTDVIVGFPGESEEQFNDSMNLIREVKPDVLNISRFWPRPGTKAEKMKSIHGRITKERSRKMTELHKRISLERNKKWIGWRGEVLIDESGKNRTWMGRNSAYKPIVVKCGENLLGKFVNVEIVNARNTYLLGEKFIFKL